MPSFNNNYGPEYWPAFHSVGNNDEDVLDETRWVMENHHPHFLWVYLADVDHAGHSGNWNEYISAIQTADEVVGVIWDKIQTDPFYKDKTTLFVTNDHGRHDDDHGGFSGHGCGCEGCRHIMFLAAGPDIKQNVIETGYRVIPDMAVSASYLLGLTPEYATGDVMEEIFRTQGLGEDKIKSPLNLINFPNPFSTYTTIHYQVQQKQLVALNIYDLFGNLILNRINYEQATGNYSFLWEGKNDLGSDIKEGVYICTLTTDGVSESIKIIHSK